MRKLLTLIVILVSFVSFGQKKVIDHTVYNDWKSLANSSISNDGKYISYEVNPHRGDGYLFIYNTETKELDSIPRGKKASFSGGSSYLAFTIKPGYDTLRTCELDKINKKKWPQDTLGIYIFENDSLIKMPKIGSFEVNDENDWAVLMFKNNKIDGPKKKKRIPKRKRPAPYKSNGHAVRLYNPAVDKKIEFKDVKSYEISEKGRLIVMTIHQKVEQDSMHLQIFNTESQDTWTSTDKYNSLQKVTFNEQQTKVAYLASNDTAKVKVYSLGVYSYANNINSIVADTNSSFIPKNDAASIHYPPMFSKDGKMVYFGVAEIEYEEPKDTLLDSEKVKLDLWHYEDKRLQPQQLLEVKRDKKKSDLYVYHLPSNTAIQLGSDTLNIRAKYDIRGKYLLATSTEPYAHSYNWAVPRPQDYYRVDIETGNAQLLQRAAKFGVDLSPSGTKYTYFNNEDGGYYVVDTEKHTEECMTCDREDVKWTADMNGMPMDAYPAGELGWNKGETITYLQSEYDIWGYTLETKTLESVTYEMGAEDKIKLSPRPWSYDSVYVHYENIYIEGFDEKTKGTHIYNLVDDGDHFDVRQVGYYDARVYILGRSKDMKRTIMRKMTFEDYPDLFTYTTDLQEVEQVSKTNPQQSQYNWGTVELVNWESYDGTELEGLLYKPENYDPAKSYPLMVYFYELYSQRLHSHYIPKPTASIIYATEYASAGYVVFMPDIRYKEGHPGQSAYDCIMSGTDHVLDLLPNVDSTRMALQGQSWGGYQTAQLVTMTERYSAAMAGAPVSNMFSAYGGIRWGSGYNRQFQYEKTQSRIGYTIWEKPELYVENSPLFHLPNVTTPLLIMHNDGDGAVPWYQGIELFTGLKRLDKASWLLNYNGDGHNLMRNANRMDLSIRMRQFFDHYLLGTEAPEWLIDGIPATEKGKELRY